MSASLHVFKCCFSKENQKSPETSAGVFKQKLQHIISGFSSMNMNRLRTLCIEVFKTLNNLNPSFVKEIFSLRQTNRPVWEKYKLNLDIPSYNQVTFGRKTLRFFGPKTWNSLPYHIKSAENLASLKRMIKFGNGETCSCKFKFKFFFFSFSDKASWKFLFRNSTLSNDSRFC